LLGLFCGLGWVAAGHSSSPRPPPARPHLNRTHPSSPPPHPPPPHHRQPSGPQGARRDPQPGAGRPRLRPLQPRLREERRPPQELHRGGRGRVGGRLRQARAAARRGGGGGPGDGARAAPGWRARSPARFVTRGLRTARVVRALRPPTHPLTRTHAPTQTKTKRPPGHAAGGGRRQHRLRRPLGQHAGRRGAPRGGQGRPGVPPHAPASGVIWMCGGKEG
jgi:hypothetical protein